MRYLLLLVSTPTPCSTCGSPQPGPVTVYEGVEAALLEVEHLDVAAALQWVQVQSGVTWHDSHLVSLDSEEQSSPVQGQTLPEILDANTKIFRSVTVTPGTGLGRPP